MKKIFVIAKLALLLLGCGTSESAVQTAIAQTEAAKPTFTYTVLPTDTPSATPSPTFTLTPSEIPTETPTLTPSLTPSETATETPKPLPLEERILGSWTGAYENTNGDKIPATWSFYEGGVMVTEITLLGMSFGGDWWVEGNRLFFTTDVDPETNYRDIVFITDDVMRSMKDEFEIVETWTRKKE